MFLFAPAFESRATTSRTPSWISRLKTEIHRCGKTVFVQHFLPAPPAVRRPENSSLFVRSGTMAHRRNQDDIRIVRIDQDSSDMSRVLQSEVLPVFPAVKGFVNSISIAAVGKNRIHTRSNVDDVRIRRRQRQRTNRSDRLLSKIGFHTVPPSVVFHTPPPSAAK